MTALDTNVLVRFLVGDDEQQARKTFRLFKEAETGKTYFAVPLLVVLELLWVLDAVYNIARQDILLSIKDLTLMPILKFESHSAIQQFLHAAQTSKLDLSDLLIAHAARELGCEKVMTFDRNAAKHELFELVK